MGRERSVRSRFARLLGTVALATVATGCASTGAVPRPFPTPGTAPGATSKPAGPEQPISRPDGYAIAGAALALRGAPYRNGGADPTGFDCSGFTQYVFGEYGIALPREVRDQFRIGESVDRQPLAPGDLLFFTTTAPGPSHVAIAIGGDQFVHAPSSKGVVRVERLSAAYWSQRYLGARRIN